MNYTKIYNQLCESRKYRPLTKEKFYEIHHIVPKCFGGTDEDSNLVKLTYREHYIAHYLLAKAYWDHAGIRYAFLCMLRDPHGYRLLTSRMVETIKKNYTDFKTWHAKINNPGRSEKSRSSARHRMLTNNPNKGGATNHTAFPVEVIFVNGEIRKFEYMKQVTELLGFPYASVKGAVKKGTPMKKYKVLKIRKCEG